MRAFCGCIMLCLDLHVFQNRGERNRVAFMASSMSSLTLCALSTISKATLNITVLRHEQHACVDILKVCMMLMTVWREQSVEHVERCGRRS